MQWNEDASQRANQYLDEVRRACAARGMDPEPVVAQVSQRIAAQVQASGVEVVSADLVRGILAASGPAESVAAASVPPPLPSGGIYVNPLERGTQTPPAAPQVWRGSSSAPLGCFIAGAICVGLVFVMGILAAILLPALARAREAARRASCQNNMKQVGLLLRGYADGHDGQYPGLVNEPGYLIFGGEFAAEMDLALLQCPSEDTDYSERSDDGTVYLDSDYLYLGYAIRSQAEMDAVLGALHEQGNDLEALMALGQIAGPAGALVPLRADLPDPASVPVLVEWPMDHNDAGANVLYLDGHTEFVKQGSKFPVTDAFYAAVEKMVSELPEG